MDTFGLILSYVEETVRCLSCVQKRKKKAKGSLKKVWCKFCCVVTKIHSKKIILMKKGRWRKEKYKIYGSSFKGIPVSEIELNPVLKSIKLN